MQIDAKLKNKVLEEMQALIDANRQGLLSANTADIKAFSSDDKALYDRLKIDSSKIDGMIASLRQVQRQEDPIGITLYEHTHPNGMQVYNKTAPFGSVLIIYESRPDVTIEAASIAFKSSNKIKLKGGKEAINSNLFLVDMWHKALSKHGVSEEWIEYLSLSRDETQAYLKNPPHKLDLIVPRGGEKLIRFVKAHAHCPVLISGRGNNFIYIDESADIDMAREVVLNAKTSKISACNALDKVLMHQSHVESGYYDSMLKSLKGKGVEVLAARSRPSEYPSSLWEEEFLDMKILISPVKSLEEAIMQINMHSGGHSASIITREVAHANLFMSQVDAAAVYHNASTRFTDGGQFGMGAELAISTDKLHHRGPLGINELVTNKWHIHGTGQIR